MEKDVIISIKGTQKYENADQDVIELVTEGRLEREGGSYTLSYQESELDHLPDRARAGDLAASGRV